MTMNTENSWLLPMRTKNFKIRTRLRNTDRSYLGHYQIRTISVTCSRKGILESKRVMMKSWTLSSMSGSERILDRSFSKIRRRRKRRNRNLNGKSIKGRERRRKRKRKYRRNWLKRLSRMRPRKELLKQRLIEDKGLNLNCLLVKRRMA